MKNILTILLIIIISSCTNFLDVKPYGKVLPKTSEDFSAIIHKYFKKIEEGYDSYIFGNYNTLKRIEGYSDNIDQSVEFLSNGYLEYVGRHLNDNTLLYGETYKIIKDCNIIIEKLENKVANDALYNNVLASAYAIRGICYYNLSINFAESYNKSNATEQIGVSYVKSFDIEKKPLRDNLEFCFNNLINDLKKALTFEISNDDYLITHDLIKVYLARAYFWSEKWEKALPLALELTNKYPLIGGEAYKEMLTVKFLKKGNIIFKTHNISGDLDNALTLAEENSKASPFSKEFIDLFTEKEKDIRYSLLNTKRKSLKSMFFRIRSAEFCLMAAECYAHTNQDGKAIELINKLRDLRIESNTHYTASTLPQVNPEYLIKEDAEGKPLTNLTYTIITERQKELFMESNRWFDLKRNGSPEFWKANKGLKFVTKRYLYTFPLPKEDFILNPKLKQNEGYY